MRRSCWSSSSPSASGGMRTDRVAPQAMAGARTSGESPPSWLRQSCWPGGSVPGLGEPGPPGSLRGGRTRQPPLHRRNPQEDRIYIRVNNIHPAGEAKDLCNYYCAGFCQFAFTTETRDYPATCQTTIQREGVFPAAASEANETTGWVLNPRVSHLNYSMVQHHQGLEVPPQCLAMYLECRTSIGPSPCLA